MVEFEKNNTPIDIFDYVSEKHLPPNGKYNISPTTVIDAILAEFPRPQPGSRLGKEEHKRIIQSILNRNTQSFIGYPVPPIPFEIPENPKIKSEKRVYAQITDNLTLSAQYDVIENDVCVEIKPTFKDYHTIQTVLTCMAVAKSQNLESMHGMLICYRPDKAWVIADGAPDVWPLGIKICELAQQITDVQLIVNDQKDKRGGKPSQLEMFSGNHNGLLPDDEFAALNNFEIQKRREFKPLVQEMLGQLNHRFVRKF